MRNSILVLSRKYNLLISEKIILWFWQKNVVSVWRRKVGIFLILLRKTDFDVLTKKNRFYVFRENFYFIKRFFEFDISQHSKYFRLLDNHVHITQTPLTRMI